MKKYIALTIAVIALSSAVYGVKHIRNSKVKCVCNQTEVCTCFQVCDCLTCNS